MKKYLHIFVWLLLASNIALAQVLADFESGDNGFAAEEWGNMLNDGSGPVADPTGISTGVFKMSLTANNDGNEKAAFACSSIGSFYGKVISYNIWLPANTPADLTLKVFSQTTDNWDWKDMPVKAGTLTKEKWVKVYLDLEYLTGNGADYSKVKKFGIEFNLQGAAAENKSWSGDIYIDNVCLLGALPVVYGDFESSDNGFGAEEWGNMLNDGSGQVADPTGISTGVFKMSLTANNDGNEKAAFANGSVGTLEGKVISYNIWLPANTPDDLLLKVFSQTTDNWDWKDMPVQAKTLAKEKWVKVYLDMEYLTANGADYSKVKKFGIEFNLQGAAAGSKTWSGDIYIDNVLGLSTTTEVKWIVSDFESENAGTQDFVDVSWANASTSLKRIADPTGKSVGVLAESVDFTKDTKDAFFKNGVQLVGLEPEVYATAATFDVYVPADAPDGLQIGIVASGSAVSSGWEETPYIISDSGAVKKGMWNTLTMDLKSKIDAGAVDPTKPASFGSQLYIASSTWKGDILYDNFTLVGIEKPQGALSNPPLTAAAESNTVIGGTGTANYVRFDWVDNTLGTEKYNIYKSSSPITDIAADGVVKFAPGIPHGLESYALRPYSRDGVTQDMYFLLTSSDGVEETPVNDDSKAGPVSIQTTPTFKIHYVDNFADSFVLDGFDTEFENYKDFQIIPETAGGNEGTNWAPGSTDLDFKVTMVVDAKYMYISGDVTDDDLRDDPAGQAWEGDALEFYMGFYDVRTLKNWHGKNYSGSNGDWRVGFTSRGETTLSGGSPSVIPGVEATVFPKFSGDGYIIEAKIAIDSMAASPLTITDGFMFPARIDCNDMDPNLNGDTERTLILQVGGVAARDVDLNEDWTRPHCWGMFEVVGGPTAVEDELNPISFRLFNNYPNPFNPSTMIKFDLPASSFVTLKVFDILGREVATLVNGVKNAGHHQVEFNASSLATGTYIYQIKTADNTVSKKMLLIK